MSLILTLALLKVIPGELRLKSFPSPHGLSALWQRPTFPGRQTRRSAQGRDKGEEMLTGPKLMAKCLVLQAQCTGGGDEWARGRDSGMPSWSEVPVGLLLWTRVGGCSQGGVRT